VLCISVLLLCFSMQNERIHPNNTTAYTGKFSGSFETLQFLSCAHCTATMVAWVIDNVVALFYGEMAVIKCGSGERKLVRKSCRNKSEGSKNSEEGTRRRCQMKLFWAHWTTRWRALITADRSGNDLLKFDGKRMN
jgi:hypothetical protein